MKFLGILDTQQHKIFDITARKSNKKLLTKISTDEDFVAKIRTLTPDNKRSCNLVSAKKHPVSLQLKETMRTFTVKEIVLYNDNCIEVCDTNIILAQILRGRHKIKPSRHPGKSKTLSLTRRSFMWLSMTAYMIDMSAIGVHANNQNQSHRSRLVHLIHCPKQQDHGNKAPLIYRRVFIVSKI